MIKFTYSGLMPPVFTPFKHDGSINFAVIPKYVKYLHDKNIKGILVNGTSGEGMSMNTAERKKVAEIWIDEAHKLNMHAMIQIGGASLPDVLDMAKHAEEHKADSLLTLPELFNKPKTVEDLTAYLKLIGEQAPKTPLLYYHNPAYTGVTISMTELVKQAKLAIPTFRGMKYTSCDLLEAQSVLEESKNQFAVFLGADQLLLPAITQNLNSAIGTSYNMVPEFSQKIIEKMNNRENLKECIDLQAHLVKIINAITSQGDWVPTMKMAMEILTDIEVGPPRPPLKALTGTNCKFMENEFRKLKLL